MKLRLSGPYADFASLPTACPTTTSNKGKHYTFYTEERKTKVEVRKAVKAGRGGVSWIQFKQKGYKHWSIPWGAA
jgi:hypothetical protein